MEIQGWIGVFGRCALIISLTACGSGGTNPGGTGGEGSDGGGNDGGGGGPTSPFTAPSESQALYFVNDLPGEFSTVRDTFGIGGPTPFANLPQSNTVAYNGFMELAFFSTPTANIRSQATLSVDMQTGATSGTASEFMGWVNNPATGLEELALYEGDVVLSAGTLNSGTSGQALYDMQISGALNNGEQAFTVSGQIDGAIYGTTAGGLFATGSDFGGSGGPTFTSDGQDVFGTAAIWALKQ